MMRLLLLFSILFCSQVLWADELDKQLSMLLPDEAESRQTERQYVKRKLTDLITQLKADRLDRKSTKKKIRGITERVQALYLKNYAEHSKLEDFFRNGKYNDNTLAIVYSLLMETFEVPWFAMVDHWSVHILADPSGKKQQLATVGRQHDRAVERGYRAEYVQLLNLTVLPGRRPTTSAGIDSLYYTYHYKAKELLNFNQLAAYWHYERALNAYYYRDYLLTIRRLSLAKQLEDRLAFSALEQATYVQLANLEGDDGQQALFYLFELWNKDPDNQYIPAALITDFIHETDLLIKGDTDFLPGEQLYHFLDSRAQQQPAWRMELKELYYLQKTRHAAVRERYDEVRTYVDSLYHMEPENPVFRKLAGDLSLWTLRSSGATGPELKEQLGAITKRYPFVSSYKGIDNLVLADLAKEIRGFYEADQGYDGDNLLLQFRNRLATTTPGPRRSMWVLTAYLSASNYYFRMKDYRQALNLINEGLRYSPENDYLLHRKEVLEKY